jgi:hypothetical protein
LKGKSERFFKSTTFCRPEKSRTNLPEKSIITLEICPFSLEKNKN